ncbi:helix-turn-helix domain-containing protein [Nocardia sp. NBC_01503]|uniref:helix-turn-helix domain-containing protein n=1 Tax=Nocardia sp. NBC_01503 TaxID=2975997 RepID=UPI002E7B7F7A|nr:helix-turn-helix domain-containing protein [Nocardia sp. NBC_01503]WTL33361.1 helix-turn-helix domain-containing protein [Nocardia sp. NBC_01503]
MNAKDRIAQNIAYFRNKTVNPETGVPPMTQEQLADAIGMTKRQVGRYEQGDQEPSGSTLDKIADALNLAPGQLFRRTQTGPDLSGLWWVSCQVWKDGVERVDTNAVMVLQDGDHLTLDSDRAQGENAIEAGDYAWVGELVHRRATRTLIGWYESADEGTDYSGSYCFTLHPQGTHAVGQWCGPDFDGIVVYGWAIMARSKALAEQQLALAIADAEPNGNLRTWPKTSP